MKQTILILLIVVMIATPCLAQELEPEGIFSIEETGWAAIGIAYNSSESPKVFMIRDSIRFYQGEVYDYCTTGPSLPHLKCYPNPFYKYFDSPLVAIAYSFNLDFWPDSWYYNLYIMQPIGFGFFMGNGVNVKDVEDEELSNYYMIGTMFKFENNKDSWTPAETQTEPPPGVE